MARAVSSAIQSFHSSLTASDSTAGVVYVETAGGVHSPSLHPPHTQSTSLRSLRLPSILIASPHLGGISNTLTSYESLILRGYSISAVLCLRDSGEYYRNYEFLSQYFAEQGIKFWDVPAPPPREGKVEEDGVRLERWYENLSQDVEPFKDSSNGLGKDLGAIQSCVDWLDEEHQDRIRELDGMAERTLSSVWYPFTQHAIVNKKEDIMVIDSAHDDCFDAFYARPSTITNKDEGRIAALVGSEASASSSLLRPYFDGSASWFTQSHGHAAEELTLAAASAAGRYGHVLFPSGSHAPALQLAEKLLETVGQGWASRVFYSDDGSTGVEVALKMAIRAAGRRYGWDGVEGAEVGIIGLRGGYHGDTVSCLQNEETRS